VAPLATKTKLIVGAYRVVRRDSASYLEVFGEGVPGPLGVGPLMRRKCHAVDQHCICLSLIYRRARSTFYKNVLPGNSFPIRLVRLAFSDNEFVIEIFLADLTGFFLNPAFQPDVLDAAEIEDFEIVGISRCLIGRGGEEGAREIIAVTAQIHTFCFHAIQSCASVWQMKMLSVFLAATSARYLVLRNTHFGMDQFSELACQIVFVQLTIEAIQPTRRC